MRIENVTACSMKKAIEYRKLQEKEAASNANRKKHRDKSIKKPIKIVERINWVRTTKTIKRPQ